MSIRMVIGAHFVVATVGVYLGWEMWNKGSNHLKCNWFTEIKMKWKLVTLCLAFLWCGTTVRISEGKD